MAEALFWLCFWVSQYPLSLFSIPGLLGFWPHFLLHPDIWLSAGPPVPSFPGGGDLLLGRLGVWADRTGTKYSIGRQVTINLIKPLDTKTWTKLLQLQVGKPALPVCVMQSIALISALFGAYELANTTDRTSHPMSTSLYQTYFLTFDLRGLLRINAPALFSSSALVGSGNGLGSCALKQIR